MIKPFRTGASTIVIVVLIMFFCISLIAILQSRFLVSLNRNQSFADSTIVNFVAESQINDLIRRAFGGYPSGLSIPFTPITTTTAGTTVTISGVSTPPSQTITAIASRNGATTKFSATSTTYASQYSHSTIVFLLDATSSMVAPADPANPTGPTRYEALRQSVVNFIDQVNIDDPTHTQIYIGLAVFRNDTKWLKDSSNTLMTPTTDTAKLIAAINTGFTIQSGQTYPPAYNQVFGNTSVGSPLLFSKTYWAGNPDPTSKNVEILITDGEPDTAIPDSRCNNSYYCPNLNFYCNAANIPAAYNWRCNKDASGAYVSLNISNETLPTGQCLPPAKNLVKCGLARQDVFLSDLNQYGLRPIDTDSYVLTVQGTVQPDVKTIFTTYANQYFELANASSLSSQLQAILDLIQSTTTLVYTR